ncbi:hypothetical protein [Methylococcus sp. EFPC2]|uniref:hypothetical protein n=1 Tax=Methylococcus sp. EFPC2 TaxID=2812648 RepID=UPI0019679C3B|nr:hypothetical protein [Methylococcus sp. EFPC2]QSA97732.1 hypothetical protein JWZ97_02550 [Methylococcus sp. EFPC2]
MSQPYKTPQLSPPALRPPTGFNASNPFKPQASGTLGLGLPGIATHDAQTRPDEQVPGNEAARHRAGMGTLRAGGTYERGYNRVAGLPMPSIGSGYNDALMSKANWLLSQHGTPGDYDKRQQGIDLVKALLAAQYPPLKHKANQGGLPYLWANEDDGDSWPGLYDYLTLDPYRSYGLKTHHGTDDDEDGDDTGEY